MIHPKEPFNSTLGHALNFKLPFVKYSEFQWHNFNIFAAKLAKKAENNFEDFAKPNQ